MQRGSRTVNEAVEETEKHMLGALCEDLGGANEQTCTRKLHFSHRYHHLVLQSVPQAHICRNTVATARSGPSCVCGPALLSSYVIRAAPAGALAALWPVFSQARALQCSLVSCALP